MNSYLRDIKEWDKVDDLYLFLAILQGKWEKYSNTDIRNYAYSRLSKLKGQRQQHQKLYEACAVFFYLSFEYSFLTLDSSGQICDVTCQNTQPYDRKQLKIPLNDDQDDLPTGIDRNKYNWAKLFYSPHRKMVTDFHMSIMKSHYCIRNYLNFDNHCHYHYDEKNFKGPMDALRHYLLLQEEKCIFNKFREIQDYRTISEDVEFEKLQKRALDLFTRSHKVLLEILRESGLQSKDEQEYEHNYEMHLSLLKSLQESELNLFQQSNKSTSANESLQQSQEEAVELFKKSRKFALKMLSRPQLYPESQPPLYTYIVKKFSNQDDKKEVI